MNDKVRKNPRVTNARYYEFGDAVHSDESDIDLGALKPGVRLLLELAQIGSSLPKR